MSSTSREDLLIELITQVREEQEDVQAFDEEAARVLGVNLTDVRVLGILDREGRLTASVLAEEAGLTTGSMTTLIDRLEVAGYVRRVRDKVDRRRVFVELTALARERTGKIWGPLGEEALGIAEGYTDEELRLLIDYLARGRNLLKRHKERVRAMGDHRPAQGGGG